ncbi:uncharacterized protein LOC135227268 [Loxodonta africana]|uniref:uncharacterized protein LOC135227268 n=1 Tax=Loxodonta africana TaxID=9785 RepID=UPI0030CD187E
MSEETPKLALECPVAKAKGRIHEVKELNRRFQRASQEDKIKCYNDICKELEMENQKGRTCSAFLKLKELKKKFKPRVAIVKDSMGKILNDAGSIKRRWKEYTESLYQKELVDIQPFQEVAYDQEPMVLKEEVQASLKALVKNKAAGIDGISIETFQQTDAALKVLTHLCQEIWKTASWPTDWKRSIFMPIPKKGDPTECGNYRTISLISHASKILLKIIQKRLQQYINGELPEIQAGFRRGRGTRDIIADVRWILGESREYRKDVYLCFIDYAKAFDCVDHNKLWMALRMGVSEHLIVLMRNLYIDQEAVVQTGLKSGKVCVRVVFFHHTYLTCMLNK